MKIIVNDFINSARNLYGNQFIPLHRPLFKGNEKKYLDECIDTNFVSSVGKRVEEFEKKFANLTGSKYAIATVNGTNALYIAIKVAGIKYGDEIISQALTFVATCNAIAYSGANPIFIDVDKDTLGMSPTALENFLKKNADRHTRGSYNKQTGKKIAACIPMHSYGFPCRIKEISDICSEWGITVIEDAAESLGSYVGKKHTGTFSLMSSFSFNGNKIITTGGGGMIITDNFKLAKKAKHIVTTAKVSHPYEYIHDEIGYNYRMPNLNASLGCAQLEKLDEFLFEKKKIAMYWKNFFKKRNINCIHPLKGNKANNWLNTIVLKSKKDKEFFLKQTNKNGVMTRPTWRLMSELKMFKRCQNDGLKNSLWLQDRVVNIPSSVPDEL
tara:strand:+ start:677 stop:1828 length:1152 start_codon:yes stop_codon:yes gene_type:complete